ncbi:hypothetical protein LC76P1_00018 [Lysinibacillus phage LC76P1]|nr:hypothetical protein LC76P1_00018 [Lysinibacillus phage LC76P1]
MKLGELVDNCNRNTRIWMKATDITGMLGVMCYDMREYGNYPHYREREIVNFEPFKDENGQNSLLVNIKKKGRK